MQDQPPTRLVAPCPVCGAEPRYRAWSYFMAEYVSIRSRLTRFFSRGSKPEPLVCTVCGYVQLFVNPEDFRG